MRASPTAPPNGAVIGVCNGVIYGLRLHDLGDQDRAGTQVEIAPDHVSLPGVGDAQLHVDIQFFGRPAVGDQLLFAEGGVLAVDPDVVELTG